MTPTINDERQSEETTNSITSDIENKSYEIECKDIGKRWTKKCPECGELLYYSRKDKLTRAVSRNAICKECYKNNIQRVVPIDGWARKCPSCNKMIKYNGFRALDAANISNSLCKSCSGKYQSHPSPISNRKFIRRCKKIHGNKYDYSHVKYKNTITKIKIKCKKHGYFYQIASNHANGQNCPSCELDRKRQTKEEFIKKCKLKYGNKFDYSRINYVNNVTKIKILCPKHGYYWQTPSGHYVTPGCPGCGFNSNPEKQFLKYMKIPVIDGNRQNYIKPYWIDGIDKHGILYEFLGDYYHGNPLIFFMDDYNKVCHKTFGELYQKTFQKFEYLKNKGYRIKYIWEADWNNFINGTDTSSIITEYD